MNIYFEILGYAGTVIIIISMMMHSIVKLRIFNVCGSVLSTIYSIAGQAWPIVIMNLVLMSINCFHLCRHFIKSAKDKKSTENLIIEQGDKYD